MEEERKSKLEMQKQLKQEYAKPFNPPQSISAFAYIVFELDPLPKHLPAKQESPKKKFPHSHKIIVSQNSRCMVEVASLTKIMTCIVALEICSTNGLDANKEEVYVGKFESNIGGTTAHLSEGEFYTLHDLYYGLMLPSGNDASVAIAVWGGKVLLGRKEEKKKVYYERFIGEMNRKAKALGMEKTNYANSHGLVNSANKSCALDLALLCEYAMRNNEFKKIVSSKFYSTEISYFKPVSPVILNKYPEEKLTCKGVKKPKDRNDEDGNDNRKEDKDKTEDDNEGRDQNENEDRSNKEDRNEDNSQNREGKKEDNSQNREGKDEDNSRESKKGDKEKEVDENNECQENDEDKDMNSEEDVQEEEEEVQQEKAYRQVQWYNCFYSGRTPTNSCTRSPSSMWASRQE